MEVYNQFIDQSTCVQSLYCHFVSPTTRNLIISKGNILQVFEVIETVSQESQQSKEFNALINGPIDKELELLQAVQEEPSQELYNLDHKLSLVTEYKLNGEIVNLTNFKSKEDDTIDYLIVSTRIAKLSVVKWDIANHCISTVSLHYYEPALECLSIDKLSKCNIKHRTDPNGFCTSIEINEIFTFLPFRKVDLDDMDDEDESDEFDRELKVSTTDDHTTAPSSREVKSKVTEQRNVNKQLFEQSFMINASTLFPGLKNIVDYQYLHSYGNPTIAVLHAPESMSWAGYLPKVKDNMRLTVLSLDLKNKKASAIVELSGLPYDLETIYPVPDPVKGLLLMGANEIIYVNTVGTLQGVAVNSFYKDTSDLKLNDQKQLELFLEDSKVAFVGNDQALLITESGEFVSLKFVTETGKSKLESISKVNKSSYSDINITNVLHITNITDSNTCFVCSQGSDSLLLEWEIEIVADGIDQDGLNTVADKDDDDFLYYDKQESNEVKLTNSKFRISDSLENFGPISDYTFGKISTDLKIARLPNPNLNEEAIVSTCGLEENGGLSIINPSVIPIIKSSLKFSNVDKIWTLKGTKGQTRYLITTDFKNSQTQIFWVQNKYRPYFSKDFDNKQATVQFGTIKSKSEKMIARVMPFKVVLFNFKFHELHSIEYEGEINSATVLDKYIIVIMKNGEIDVLEYLEEENKLEKMDLPALLNYLIFTNGWITDTSILNHVSKKKGSKRSHNGTSIKSKENKKAETTFWMVTADNRLLVFKKEHKEKVFEFKDIHLFPEILKLSAMDPNYEADVDPLIKQAIFTKLGNKFVTKDYLMILTYGGEVLMYEMYFDATSKAYKLQKINEKCHIPIVGAPDNSYAHATKIERNLIKMEDLQGSQCVFASGATSYLISKTHNSSLRMHTFTTKPILYFASFHGDNCKNGFITVDNKKCCRICELDTSYNYTNTVPMMKVKLGETINQIEYHESLNLYVASALHKVPFEPLDDDGNPLPGSKENVKRADTYRGYIKLISPVSWSVIDTVELDENEVCNSLKVMRLRISDSETKMVITVGTGQYKVEDLATNGSWKVYEIISVVPDANRPEAKFRLKLSTSETLKGPISSICDISGRFASVQGQRMLIRALKNDGNLAPVAFTDTSIYTKDTKSFLNLVLIGDSYHSVSLYGFDAEPYRMLPLSKDERKVEVTACDFISFNGNLFVLVSDEDSVLHLLQYDPFDIDSLKGSKLLRRSVFRFNSYTTVMKCVNRNSSAFSMVKTLPQLGTQDLGFEVIASNIDGSFYKVVPVDEAQYRRLYAIQNFITERESHPLGLNPKLSAIGGLSDVLEPIKRPFIDLRLVSRFIELDEAQQKLLLHKLGRNALVAVYGDLIALQ